MTETSLQGVTVLVTGAAGNGGRAICRALAATGCTLRLADVAPPPTEDAALGTFVRCDTRTPADARAAVAGVDAVVHLVVRFAIACGVMPRALRRWRWMAGVAGRWHGAVGGPATRRGGPRVRHG